VPGVPILAIYATAAAAAAAAAMAAWLMDDSNSCSRSTVLGHAIEVSPLLAAG